MKSKKVTKKLMLAIGIWLLACGCVPLEHYTPDWPQWQGLERNGLSKETGLLKEWPEEGPKLLWSAEGIGSGFSSLSIANGVLYITGTVDNVEILSAYDLDGNLKWKKEYGKAFSQSYPDARTTPTVDGNSIYVISGTGEVVCFDAMSGDIKWSVQGFDKFKGKHGSWGIAESPLVVDDKVIYTPCGEETTVVALDKNTGETVWTSESLNDQSAYVSPILVKRGGKKLIVGVTGDYIIGVNAENGKIEWKFNYRETSEKSREINAVTPIYHDGYIYVTSGYDHGGAMLKLSEDGTNVSLVWVDYTLDTHHGGVVLVDGYIYGSNWINNGQGNWVCVDWNSGKVMYEKDWHNKGPIISADGMLYCYEEKTGNFGLVKTSPEDFTVVSSFKITQGKGQHWAHPVISDGRLYIRHGDVLMVYDIKAK